MKRVFWLVCLVSFARSITAFEGMVYLPDGSPAAGYQVSVVGRPGSALADQRGHYTILPDPPPPFYLVVTGPGGELYAPQKIGAIPPDGPITLHLVPHYKESVTVTSGVTPNIPVSPASGTMVIGQEDMDVRQPQKLPEMIEGVPGAWRSNMGPDSVPSLRGLTRGRTLILLDDARVTTERRAGSSATFLDPFVLSSVEVARGAGSVAYGSDAFGGVILARPRYPVPGTRWFRYQLGGSTGGLRLGTVGAEVAGGVPGGAALAEFHLRDSGNQHAPGGEEIPNSSFEGIGGSLRYTAPTRIGTVKAAIEYDHGEDIGKPTSDSMIVRSYYPKEDSARFNLGVELNPPAGWTSLNMKTFAGQYRLITDRETLVPSHLIERSDADAWDASARLTAARPFVGGYLQLGFDATTRFGLNAVSEKITFDAYDATSAVTRETSIEDARRIDTGAFLTIDRPFNTVFLVSAGLRADYVATRNRGGYFGDHSTANTAASGHLAGTFAIAPTVTATLQLASGFRDPMLSDRYFRGTTGRGFITGNPELQPERSYQLDAVVRWKPGAVSVNAFAYAYRISDLIERHKVGKDYYFRNRGEAEFTGFEMEMEAPLRRGFTLQIAAATERGESADDGAALDDVAPGGGWVTLRWAGRAGFAYARLAGFVADDRPGPTEVATPGFATLDLGAGWQVRPGVEVRAKAGNVTDARYPGSAEENAAWAPGRSLIVSVGGQF